MAVWSKIKLTDINTYSRIDGDFYKPEYLDVRKKLLNYKNLSHYISQIIHPGEFKRIYSDEGISVLRAQNIRPMKVDFESNSVFVPKSIANNLTRNKLKYGDVLITRTGANFGQTAIYVDDTKNAIVTSHTFIVKTNENINSAYLALYLNTKFGRKLLDQGMYGSSQPEIAPKFIKIIPVPTFNKNIENRISDDVIKAYKLRSKSQTLYQQAKSLLEKELGLDKITFDNPKSYTASFSEVVKDGRISSYFFEPKFKQLDSLINNFETTPLRALINNYSTGFAFAKKHLTKEKTDAPLIKIANIKLMDIDIESSDFVNALGKEAGSSEIIKKDDILIGMSGSVGTSAVIREKTHAYINQRILRINSFGKIDPEYLAVVINSKIGKMQFEKYGTGGVQINISPRDMLNINIPRLGKVESEISLLIKQSFIARKESKHLLEQAKTRVERLIEEGAKKQNNEQ